MRYCDFEETEQINDHDNWNDELEFDPQGTECMCLDCQCHPLVRRCSDCGGYH